MGDGVGFGRRRLGRGGGVIPFSSSSSFLEGENTAEVSEIASDNEVGTVRVGEEGSVSSNRMSALEELYVF